MSQFWPNIAGSDNKSCVDHVRKALQVFERHIETETYNIS